MARKEPVTGGSKLKCIVAHFSVAKYNSQKTVISKRKNAFPIKNRKGIFFSKKLGIRYYTLTLDALYIVVGIREDGLKEVLAYTMAPTEFAFVWKEVLLDLKERGIEEVLLFITSGLKGVTVRNEICDDFKSFYLAVSRKLDEEELKTFIGKWKTAYPKVTKSLQAIYISSPFAIPQNPVVEASFGQA